MNRGVMVTRGDPDETELETSARYIAYRTITFLMSLLYSLGEYVLMLKMIQ